MNSIFSVEDLELLWQGPVTGMSRSPSEWELERFLEEFPASSSSVINDDNNNHHHNNVVNVTVSASTTVSSSKGREDDVIEIEKPSESDNQRQPLDQGVRPIGGKDTDDYHAFLKSQLDLACAAAAKSRGLNVKAEGVSVQYEDQSLAAHKNSCQTGPPISANGPGVLKGQSEIDGGSARVSALPALPKKQELAARQATSVSSREDSDDDELEGDTGNNDNMDPSNDKRARRMQSNRESARRSRRRKQAQLTDLEAQVGQLRDERTSLLTRLTDINKKCDDASVDNRILNANIETLRTKVKMAEDQVKRVTGLSPLALGRSSMPSMGMQFVSGQTDPSANVGLPVQPNNRHFFHHPVPDLTSGAPHLQRLNNNSNLNPLAPNLPVDNGTSNIGRMASMQQLAGAQSTADVPPLQHAHKQSGSTVKLPAVVPVNNNGPSQLMANDNKKN